ncbi:MAG: aminotransferase class III-fold pyridoxal phosphate-dependent enzyme [Alphaproteobacteria bacterium]|nr:aminotransferase class III-fold pyridoxal phosphate-dependent enzyme [Alphaproteobacteria bacterium]
MTAENRSLQSFSRSNHLYERALKRIPGASQTFSKSAMQYVRGVSPLFLERGEGCRVWDVDGNEYIDLVGGLLPIVLGYRDPDVDNAIRAQLEKGISFSLATSLEVELAERLARLIPCAEMTRFGKNGSDAVSGAIRLARAYTGRDRVACCGYHGWHDWYIATTSRNLGVPPAVGALTSTFQYNDIDSLESLLRNDPDGYAAIILEPMTFESPQPQFLEQLKELCDRYGALLIFDEVITGFRIDLGGAQRFFGVTPDLACFGKAMGNGMPISAVVGRAEIMDKMNDIFFSGTFGGEALSLAAAIATIDKLERVDAIPRIKKFGHDLSAELSKQIVSHHLGHHLRVIGADWWPGLQVTGGGAVDSVLFTSLLRQELIGQGILQCASANLSLAHTESGVLEIVLKRWDRALATVRSQLDGANPALCLRGKPIEAVFRVRG